MAGHCQARLRVNLVRVTPLEHWHKRRDQGKTNLFGRTIPFKSESLALGDKTKLLNSRPLVWRATSPPMGYAVGSGLSSQS